MASDPLDALASEAMAALADGSFAKKEAELRRAIAASPEDAKLLLTLGIFLGQAGRFGESAKALQKSVQISEAPAVLLFLARTQMRSGDPAASERTLERLAQLKPDNVNILARLAKVKTVLGNRNGARRILERAHAIDPRHVDVAIALTDGTDTQSALDLMRSCIDAVGDRPALASRALRHLAQIQNREARRRSGLPATFTVSWQDTCRWLADDALLEYRASLERELPATSAEFEVLAQLTGVAISRMEWDKAERYFRQSSAPFSTQGIHTMAVDMAMWDSIAALPEAEMLGDLPAIVPVQHGGPAGPGTLFLASDPAYFERFTIQLLKTLSDMNSVVGVHVHLMDGTADIWAKLAEAARAAYGRPLTVTAENSGAAAGDFARAKNYYHAVRFVRFYQTLKEAQGTVWLMDVDATILKDPSVLLPAIAGYDMALRGKPNGIEPQSRIAACLVGAAPTPAGVTYLRLVSNYIAYLMRRKHLYWGIDQGALFGAYSYLHRLGREPSALFMDASLVSINGDSGAVMDFFSGARKYVAL